ncbi:Xylose isomerase-like TIM barrel [Paenibacillus sophorae]|uniref:Sugar phosphate isomerase/epimerase n=1 Tax=Paenibacillus sophorae TaxID=1333845 RepID=A0A1H8PEQ6_9BACL|nr:sugar phosphate isomerase/epimerase [Paenibacillus sophorae]QWU16543.1 sugar phosphate isomerase/epimerase [Paenibacillus sophorae]SEO40184.1 Xylose isomerase-like TIM barrel [Paenibacillus sophorae]
MMNVVFVPTSVFGSVCGTQYGLAEPIRSGGADGIEIRRELFPSGALPLAECREAILRSGLRCVYSVPMELWNPEGRLNEEVLSHILAEAAVLRPEMLKVSLGYYAGIPGFASEDELRGAEHEQLGQLERLLRQYRETAGELTLLIENDQTSYGGRAENLKAFFQAVERCGLGGVKMTFDTGNWLYSGEDPLKAAVTFAPYVAYIHCKHVIRSDGVWVTLPLPQEKDALWRKLLGLLPGDVPRAIEFGLPEEGCLEGYIEMLRGGCLKTTGAGTAEVAAEIGKGIA